MSDELRVFLEEKKSYLRNLKPNDETTKIQIEAQYHLIALILKKFEDI